MGDRVTSQIENPPDTVHGRVRLHESGPALWPEYIDVTKLDDSLRDVGTPIFETMFQGRRGGLAGTIISEEYFRYYRGEPPGTCYMTVDPAISLKTTADETAVVIGNVKLEDHREAWPFTTGPNEPKDVRQGSIYLRWIWHGRLGVKDQEAVIYEAWRYYKPVAIGIEAVAYQSALVQLLEADHPELPIEPVRPDRDKISRFLFLAALYEFGRVYHHPDLRSSAGEYQLTHLPNGRHDDIPDAIAYLAQMAGISSGAVALGERPRGFR